MTKEYELIDFTCFECGGHNKHLPNCHHYKKIRIIPMTIDKGRIKPMTFELGDKKYPMDLGNNNYPMTLDGYEEDKIK